MNYVEALEKAIILLVDNPNITDEAGGRNFTAIKK